MNLLRSDSVRSESCKHDLFRFVPDIVYIQPPGLSQKVVCLPNVVHGDFRQRPKSTEAGMYGRCADYLPHTSTAAAAAADAMMIMVMVMMVMMMMMMMAMKFLCKICWEIMYGAI